MTELRIVARPLGGSAMVRDGHIADAARAWYAPRPQSGEEWTAHARAVRDGAASDWASRLIDAMQPAGAAADRLARVRDGRGIVVTTGQQPGLFGGPLYTWWKALSALALAEEIETVTGIPCAPVFWAATDDADFAEASETFVAVRGGLQRLALAPRDTGGAPLSDVRLGDVDALAADLAAGAGAAVYPQALELPARTYRADATIGGAYVSLLRAVLEPLGIPVLDAAHPVVRHAGRPVLRAALEHAAAIERGLAERERALREQGFRAQVPLVRGRSLVFSTRAGVRQRIAIGAAPDRGDEAGEALGPNVLLRPIMERTILPTAAYIAGPGELAYFAQVSVVADALGTAWPLPVPRWSGTVVEPHIDRLLARYALDLDALRDPHAAEGKVAREALPAELGAALDRLRGATDSMFDDLSLALRGPGAPGLPATVVTGAARDVERRLARLERRLVAASKRQATDAMTDLASLRAALFPAGAPQERKLNLFPLLARHGPALLSSVLSAARAHATAILRGAAAPDRAFATSTTTETQPSERRG